MKSNVHVCLIGATLVAGFLCHPAFAQSSAYQINSGGDIVDDRVMYSIGGGSVTGAPSSLYRPSGVGIGIGWKANMMCGNFDLSTTVKNQLNGVTDGFKNLMGEVIQNATGAVMSLPAMIIQRANPGLYELLSNGVLQGRIDFDRSKLSCQNIANKMSDYVSSTEWGEIAGGQSMQDLLGSSGSKDAVSTVAKQEQNKGNDGLSWVYGSKAGGSGQPSIKVTSDVVKAGYNALHRKPAANTASVSSSECQGGALCRTWTTPQAAAEWATRVLGESERRTCQDCEPVTTVAGSGLTPLIQEEYEDKLKTIEKLIVGDIPINAVNLQKAGSGMLPVTRRVIEVLQTDADREVLSKRLASETAMSSVLEKALLLQRTLIAGSRNPSVEQTKPAQEGVQQNLTTLSAEIQSLHTEMQIRQSLATNTASTILRRQDSAQSSSRSVQSGDPVSQRLNKAGKP